MKKKTSSAQPRGKGVNVVRLHLWLEAEDGVAFGMGRLLLLEAVERVGSLKGAAEELGMSYRAAWGKLKSTEEALGQKLLEKASSNRAGYQLTPLGRELTALFKQWFQDVENTAVRRAEDLFPFPVEPFAPPGSSEQE